MTINRRRRVGGSCVNTDGMLCVGGAVHASCPAVNSRGSRSRILSGNRSSEDGIVSIPSSFVSPTRHRHSCGSPGVCTVTVCRDGNIVAHELRRSDGRRVTERYRPIKYVR